MPTGSYQRVIWQKMITKSTFYKGTQRISNISHKKYKKVLIKYFQKFFDEHRNASVMRITTPTCVTQSPANKSLM